MLDPYFSASKIQWILDHVPDARRLAEQGDLLFGTVDTWLMWKMTQGAVHATDYTNASRTMLFNIDSKTWDQELLDLFNIPLSMMPVVKSSSELYGEAQIGGTACQSAASLAISKQHYLDKSALYRDRQKIPMAQVALC